MSNPWLQLPSHPPYVLPTDERDIQQFNERAADSHRIRLEIVPEPYLGNPVAPVVLLNLNPGFVDTDQVVHFDERFNAAALANLGHRYHQFPFYLLDPALPKSPGLGWWMKKLRALIAVTSLESVANRVFVVEIHGYHSKRFSPRLKVASQAYTRSLVLAAMDRGAALIVMRGLRHWLALVPELRDAVGLSVVKNVQNPTISPGNLDGFQGVVDAVR